MKKKKKTLEIQGLTDRLNLVLEEDFGGVKNRLATALGISAGSLPSYLRGDSVPGGEILYKLHTITGRSIDWLLSGETPQKKDQFETLSPREKEYVEKLLQIFREKRERTAIAIMNNLDEFLETPSKEEEAPPFPEKKKGGMQ